MPPLRQRVGHLGDYETGTADRAAAQMHQVEIVHGAVLGRIHAHRRNDDAVGEFQLAQPIGRKHRRRRRPVAALRRAGDPRIDGTHQIGRGLFDTRIGHPHAVGEERQSELLERFFGIAPHVLEPGEARGARALEAFGRRPARSFEGGKRLGRT